MAAADAAKLVDALPPADSTASTDSTDSTDGSASTDSPDDAGDATALADTAIDASGGADAPVPDDAPDSEADGADAATADAADTNDSTDSADATQGIGPAPGPAVPPPPDATWTVSQGCATPAPVASPACMTVKCSAGFTCMGNGLCTPDAPFALTTGQDSEVAPALASRPDGSWAIAWYTGTLDTEMHVFLQVALGGGALGPPVQIDPPGAHFAYAPSLVALQDGTWLVVWRDEQFFAGTVQFFGRRMATDGSFALAPPFAVTQGPQWSGGGSTNVVNPLAVRLRDGQVLVAWPAASAPGTLLTVHARRLDLQGVPVGAEIDTGAGGSGTESYSPAIAPLPGGACLLAWQSWAKKGHVQVFGRGFDSLGQATGPVSPLSAGTKAYEALPAVAAFADGGLFLSWKEGDVTTSTTPVSIAGKAWAADLTQQTAGQLQAVGNDPDGTYPDQGPVATLPTERVAVVWHAASADGGIYLRRYYRGPDVLDCAKTDVAGPADPQVDGPRHLPAVEALADGRILIAWTTLQAGVPRVRLRILPW